MGSSIGRQQITAPHIPPRKSVSGKWWKLHWAKYPERIYSHEKNLARTNFCLHLMRCVLENILRRFPFAPSGGCMDRLNMHKRMPSCSQKTFKITEPIDASTPLMPPGVSEYEFRWKTKASARNSGCWHLLLRAFWGTQKVKRASASRELSKICSSKHKNPIGTACALLAFGANEFCALLPVLKLKTKLGKPSQCGWMWTRERMTRCCQRKDVLIVTGAIFVRDNKKKRETNTPTQQVSLWTKPCQSLLSCSSCAFQGIYTSEVEEAKRTGHLPECVSCVSFEKHLYRKQLWLSVPSLCVEVCP